MKSKEGKSFCHKNGQTLVEVIVAAAVGTLVVTALTFTAVFSLRNANFSKISAQATKLAQEGIERVRIGRDRNQCITGLDSNIKSWNGSSSNFACLGSGSVWSYPVTGNAGNCENLTVPSQCYFRVDADGLLINIGYSQASFPSNAELITLANQTFQRVVLISDDANYQNQKKVTVIVRWNDFAGPHDSKMVTILRKR